MTTPSHCPDCGQSLAEVQRSIGYRHGRPIWCSTCDGCHGTGKPLNLAKNERQDARRRSDIEDPLAYLFACTANHTFAWGRR